MKWSGAIAAACLVALSACSGGDDKSVPQPAPTTPTPSVSQPTLSAEDARKQAAEAKAAREAENKRLQAWAGTIKKAMAAKTPTDEKLGVIITAYCRLPAVERREQEEAVILKKLYDANWQAGKWNKDLESAAEQPGACPQSLPQTLPQTG